MTTKMSTQFSVRNSASIVSLLSASRAYQAVVFNKEEDGVISDKDLFGFQDCQGDSLPLNLNLFGSASVCLNHEVELNFEEQTGSSDFELFHSPKVGAEKPGQFGCGEFVASSNGVPGRAAIRAADKGIEVDVKALRLLHRQMDDNDVPYWYELVYSSAFSGSYAENFTLALVPSFTSKLVLLLSEVETDLGKTLKPKLMYSPIGFLGV